MIKGIIKMLGLDPNDRALSRYRKMVDQVNQLEDRVSALSDLELEGTAVEFRGRLEAGEGLDALLPEMFARVREVSRRRLGLRHFDVQLMGGMALHEGKIAEMKTGEGKTLVATLAVALNALEGKGVHVVTVNDYLAKRDAEWMGPVYRGLGLTVAVIEPFMSQEDRYAAYRADITYGTNSEFGFDYLRDNMALSKREQVQRGHWYCLVDEVDSILIDEARTPLIISGPSEDSVEPYRVADSCARSLRKGEDFEVDEKERNVALTERGIARCEEILKVPNLFSDYGMSELAHKVIQALKAHHLFQRDVHYVVKDGEIVIVDEFTGRLMFGRRYSDGLHQAIEAKERVRIGRESQTLATITLQNYFRMYKKLSGMTGTAATEAEEFKEIYGMDVVVIPTHRPMIRVDHPDVIFRTQREKYNAVADLVEERHRSGQPVLVGTASIENSERVSKLLKARKIPHHVLNAKFHDKEAAIVAQAGRFGAVTVATNMAGRGTDILLGGNPSFLAKEDAASKGIDPIGSPEEYREILERYRKLCEEERKKVVAAGGLCILGTERHESRRIDNQLRGRAGRQGDPGESRFFISLEDDLLRLFGSDRIQGFMAKMGMEEGESVEHSLLTKAIENAQRKVEQMHFDIRKQLLAYDNVMNQQREAVYKERQEILWADNLIDRAWSILEDTVSAILDSHSQGGEDGGFDLKGCSLRLRSVLGPGFDAPLGEDKDLEQVRGEILDLVRRAFETKVSELGEQNASELFRFLLLNVLDSHWKEHLLAMDELRRGIGLRAIGQKDPLLEYQFESFNLFKEMLDKVREGFCELALRVRIVEERRPARVQEGRGPMLLGSSPGDGAEEGHKPFHRGPKVGRNDPCPCGSGRKYKHCCGRGE
ncbi:preprotein translocase subunit SecA [Thermanaerovibrio acidaminovorans]|uniref:Protein translocase subunit SecA n=1 Tax=Thermanaerovibrio acidaminovorans (strain ATCC 49978 / DSM 6589 / Su883) TaxID=525903 RepID=D1B9C9_THEAS|nr:preprotein translocase subunit SecA [Thermanaerovibrio acidaminovorans]ACZ18882.1 preprotein translocase, SecA subunit [Thermanaerovibrio acidaminovorans DSM 6589]